MAYRIDEKECVGCGACIAVCPMGCIKLNDNGKAEIDETICISCGSCKATCQFDAPIEG